jgi:hypothetical protein
MEEHLRLNINKNDSSKVNRKIKSVSVKGADFERDFESITDTLNYFEVLNIKLDRKTLYLRLKDGKIYKGFFFHINNYFFRHYLAACYYASLQYSVYNNKNLLITFNYRRVSAM